MSQAWYEVVALAARYVFLALAVNIVWLGWRSHRRAARESARWRSGEGARIGELRVTEDGAGKLVGRTYGLTMEGILGSSRACDVRVKHRTVRRKHLHFEQRQGCLMLTPLGGADMEIAPARGGPNLLYDGDELRIGALSLVMTFYDIEDVYRPEGAAGERRPV